MITILLIILAGISKAFMDKMKVWHDTRWCDLKPDNWWYKFANANVSWKRKYKIENKTVIPNDKKVWYYFGMFKPDYVERFPYSTTLLVFITDGWHLFQSMWTICMFGAILFHSQITGNHLFEFALLITIYLIPFNYFYDNLLDKK